MSPGDESLDPRAPTAVMTASREQGEAGRRSRRMDDRQVREGGERKAREGRAEEGRVEAGAAHEERGLSFVSKYPTRAALRLRLCACWRSCSAGQCGLALPCPPPPTHSPLLPSLILSPSSSPCLSLAHFLPLAPLTHTLR